MRTYLAIAAVAVMITGTAMAQPANRDANTPAVNTPNTPPIQERLSQALIASLRARRSHA